MQDVYLVKNEYLKSLAGINDNTDFDILKASVISVQDIYIQAVLGTALYNDLKTKLIADPTLASNPNEKDLINNYIAKVVVWYAKMDVAVESKFRIMNAGLVSKTSDKTQITDTSDLKFLIDTYRMKAESYAQLLTRHLRLNLVTFPKFYDATNIDGMRPKIDNFTSSVYLRGGNNNIYSPFDLDRC